MIAVLAREALQMIHVALCPHHHLERGNHLATSGTIAGRAKQSNQYRNSHVNYILGEGWRTIALIQTNVTLTTCNEKKNQSAENIRRPLPI